MNASRYKARVRMFKALAHPTRMSFVEELARAERWVRDLTARAGSGMSTVSKHLALLQGAGILADEKRGNQVFHRLRTPCVMDFLRCVESVAQGRPGDHPACPRR